MTDTAAQVPAAVSPQPISDTTPTDKEPIVQDPKDSEPWKKATHKVKLSGEVRGVDYETLVRMAEKAEGSEKRLAEASRKEKEIMGRIDRLKTVEDLNEVIELLGGEGRARPLLEKFLWDRIQREDAEAKLSPTEREASRRADEAERKAKQAEDQLRALNEAAETESKKAVSNQAAEMVNKEITAAIAVAEKEGLSPEDVPFMIEELVESRLVYLEYLNDCEEAGIEPTRSPLSPEDVLRKIRQRDHKRTGDVIKRLSPKELRELLSAEQLDGLRKSDIEALTTPSTQNRAKAPKKKDNDKPVDPFKEQKKTQRSNNQKDWFNAMDKHYGLR